MATNPSRRLWMALVIVHVVFQSFTGVGTLLGVDGAAAAVLGPLAVVGLVGGAVMLLGLALQPRSAVSGSWLVALGLVPTVVSVTGVVVLVAGLWTANLVFTERTFQRGWDEVAARRSEVMASRWWWWLVVAVVPFAMGWIGLYVDNWYLWFGSWVAAGLLASVGLVTGVVVLVSRHRTQAA